MDSMLFMIYDFTEALVLIPQSLSIIQSHKVMIQKIHTDSSAVLTFSTAFYLAREFLYFFFNFRNRPPPYTSPIINFEKQLLFQNI